MRDDRDVDLKGQELEGKRIEFIVSGGIGLIESPKIIRELRRYGANVRVWMTKAAQEFMQPRVFEWASKNSVITDLSGSAEHISSADAAVVVPASLDFIAKMSLGLADSPALTCVQSMIGRKPVLVQASMHHTLSESPSFLEHSGKLKNFRNFHFLPHEEAEGKWKVSSPQESVARICHLLNRKESFLKDQEVLLLVGPTRSYLDDLRYLSNYSSGRLGIQLADKLYRNGLDPRIIAGQLSVPVPSYLNIETVEEAASFHNRVLEICKDHHFEVAVCAAALLDFEFSERASGKTSSARDLQVHLRARPKLIRELRERVKKLVGFKLESQVNERDLSEKLIAWNKDNACDLVVGNRREDLSPQQHRALLWDSHLKQAKWVNSREELVKELYEYIKNWLIGLYDESSFKK